MINSSKFEYSLNAILYCLWLYEKKSGEIFDKIIDILFFPIYKYLFTKKFKKKFHEQMKKEKSAIDNFYNNAETGFYINWSIYSFGYFYSGYPASVPFLLIGFLVGKYDGLSDITTIIILAIPIALCYIPAYRAVFTKDRYLKYFKHFKKEDERWHKKWKRIALAFCIGSAAIDLLCVGAAFAIAIAVAEAR